MWNSIHKFGLTEEDIQRIADVLLENEQPSNQCPDCSVTIGELHLEGCDVSRCTTCGGQELMCECNQTKRDKWDGFWPGIKEALEQKLICCWDDSQVWQPDLNSLAMKKS
jgi:hypothetical protein